eukprot:scaffold1410_cov123-Cylindrotheca_fusiformis.AAC.6
MRSTWGITSFITSTRYYESMSETVPIERCYPCSVVKNYCSAETTDFYGGSRPEEMDKGNGQRKLTR